MVSWLWAIKHHYLLTTCSGNTCVAVNSGCCSERDNRFSSITQSRKEWQGYNPPIQVLHPLVSSGDTRRKGLEGDRRRYWHWSTNTHFLITVHQFPTTVLRQTLPLHLTEREVEIQGGGVNKPNAPECDSTSAPYIVSWRTHYAQWLMPRLCVALESDNSSNSNSSFYEIAMYKAFYKIWLS